MPLRSSSATAHESHFIFMQAVLRVHNMLAKSGSQTGKSVNPVEKLRQLIRRKTSERDKLLTEIAQCETALTPLRQRQLAMETLDREIHEQFRSMLKSPKLSKRTHKDVRKLYEELQDDQVLSQDPERAEELRRACPCPACSSHDDAAETWPAELDVEDTANGAPASHAQQRPEREASVRALYHKLALRYHPDRAEDDARRAEHEAVMREVNDAYHGGDTERLLDLSRELGIDVGELKQSDGVLAELVQQYERIKAEVRDIRSSPLGSLVAEMRRANRHGYRSPIDDLEEQAEIALDQLTAVRDFVRAFAQGKISLKTFLNGPQFEAPDERDMPDGEELFRELLDIAQQLERAASENTRSARRRARR